MLTNSILANTQKQWRETFVGPELSPAVSKPLGSAKEDWRRLRNTFFYQSSVFRIDQYFWALFMFWVCLKKSRYSETTYLLLVYIVYEIFRFCSFTEVKNTSTKPVQCLKFQSMCIVKITKESVRNLNIYFDGFYYHEAHAPLSHCVFSSQRCSWQQGIIVYQ